MNLESIARCPRCRGALKPRDGGFDCPGCNVHFARTEGGFVNFVPTDGVPLAGGPPAR